MDKRNNKGFTLLELMIVISIIGILGLVLIPKVGSFKNSAKEAGLYPNVETTRAYLESQIDVWGMNNVSVSDIETQIAAAFGSDNQLLNPITMQTSPPPAVGAALSDNKNPSLYVAGTFDGLDIGTSANKQYLSGTVVVAVKGVTNEVTAHVDSIHIYAHGKDGNVISETIVSADGTSVSGASGNGSGSGSVNVSGVSLSPSTLALNVGDSQTLTAQVAPTNATNKNVTWSSDNPAVASVDNNGLVLGVGGGQATIKVTTEDGAKTASCAVTVSVSVTQKPIQVYYKINTVYGNPLTYQYQIEITNNTSSNFSNWSIDFYLPTNVPQTAWYGTLTTEPPGGFYEIGPGNQSDIIYAGQTKTITGQGLGDGKEPIQIKSVCGYGSDEVDFTYTPYPQ